MNLINQFIQNMVLDLTINGKELILEYQRKTEKCSWSIFDKGGVEICSGPLDTEHRHAIGIENLSPDLYQLCVIDGGELLNTRFRIG